MVAQAPEEKRCSLSCILCYARLTGHYRLTHLVVNLGWVGLHFCVPPSSPPAQSLLLNSISPDRMGQAVEHSKSKSTQPRSAVRDQMDPPCIRVESVNIPLSSPFAPPSCTYPGRGRSNSALRRRPSLRGRRSVRSSSAPPPPRQSAFESGCKSTKS